MWLCLRGALSWLSLLFLFLDNTLQTFAHSWLTCPPSMDAGNPQRTGSWSGPCEGNAWHPDAPLTRIRAGETLKVGWPSNNHAGGYVRLALASRANVGREGQAALDRGVLKWACFGMDRGSSLGSDVRPGVCIHPCHASPPPPQEEADAPCLAGEEGYQTHVVIPTNLADGEYTLQWKALIANDSRVFYSCARLQVEGADQEASCSGNDSSAPLEAMLTKLGACFKPGGPSAALLGSQDGSMKLGDFCYPDANKVNKTARNHDCDPRGSCSLSLDRKECARQMMDTRGSTCDVNGENGGGSAADLLQEGAPCVPAGPISKCFNSSTVLTCGTNAIWSSKRCPSGTICLAPKETNAYCEPWSIVPVENAKAVNGNVSVSNNAAPFRGNRPVTQPWINPWDANKRVEYRRVWEDVQAQSFVAEVRLRWLSGIGSPKDGWRLSIGWNQENVTVQSIPGTKWRTSQRHLWIAHDADVNTTRSFVMSLEDGISFLMVGIQPLTAIPWAFGVDAMRASENEDGGAAVDTQTQWSYVVEKELVDLGRFVASLWFQGDPAFCQGLDVRVQLEMTAGEHVLSVQSMTNHQMPNPHAPVTFLQLGNVVMIHVPYKAARCTTKNKQPWYLRLTGTMLYSQTGLPVNFARVREGETSGVMMKQVWYESLV